MKMQIILVSKKCFSTSCIRPWHHNEDSASACCYDLYFYKVDRGIDQRIGFITKEMSKTVK